MPILSAIIFGLILLPTLAQAKCLYSPVALKTNDIYALLAYALNHHKIDQVLPALSSEKQYCHIELTPPGPPGTIFISLTEYNHNGKIVLQNAVIEVAKAAENRSRSQCLNSFSGDPEEGPIAEIEVKGVNGTLIAHLIPDEPGAPYIKAMLHDKTFACYSR